MSLGAVLEQLAPRFVVRRGGAGVLAVRSELAAAFERLGYDLDRDPRASTSELAGRSSMRELEVDGQRFLLRAFTHGGLLRSVTRARYFDASRPFREAWLSAQLQARGIATPEVAAARARRCALFGWRLDVVTRRVTGAVDGGTFLADVAHGRQSARTRAAAIRAAGAFVARMHAAGFVHADLHPKNLLLAWDPDGEPRIWVLDLDRSRFVAEMGAGERAANLARLWRYVTRRTERGEFAATRCDALRFLAGYEPRRDQCRAWLRRVATAHRRALALHRLGWLLERG